MKESVARTTIHVEQRPCTIDAQRRMQRRKGGSDDTVVKKTALLLYLNNLPMSIDFLLVCGVTFSTVCLLLYDHLALPISYDGSVPILSSIRMFLIATAGRKLIIIKKSLAQTNTDPFSVLSYRVHGGYGVCGVFFQRFCKHSLSCLFYLVIGGFLCTLTGKLRYSLGSRQNNLYECGFRHWDVAFGRSSWHCVFVGVSSSSRVPVLPVIRAGIQVAVCFLEPNSVVGVRYFCNGACKKHGFVLTVLPTCSVWLAYSDCWISVFSRGFPYYHFVFKSHDL